MSAISDLVNGWPGGIIQASRHSLFVTPNYLVNQLYATHLGAERLATRIDGPTFSSSREGTDIAVVDVVASRSADGGRIFIKVVNTDLEGPVITQITVRGARVSSGAQVDRVTADSLDAVTSYQRPDAVKLTHESIQAANSFSLELPEHSVSVVTLALAK
jgi:alpha-L-arabinofuranosidase